eukprot:1312841-Lingulodinium_polyedra.AAC.1
MPLRYVGKVQPRYVLGMPARGRLRRADCARGVCAEAGCGQGARAWFARADPPPALAPRPVAAAP